MIRRCNEGKWGYVVPFSNMNASLQDDLLHVRLIDSRQPQLVGIELPHSLPRGHHGAMTFNKLGSLIWSWLY